MTQLCDASPVLFKRRSFEREIIVFCVQWYVRGRIASRDARPSTGPEKRSAPRAGQRLRGEQSPAAGGRQRGVWGAVLAYNQARTSLRVLGAGFFTSSPALCCDTTLILVGWTQASELPLDESLPSSPQSVSK